MPNRSLLIVSHNGIYDNPSNKMPCSGLIEIIKNGYVRCVLHQCNSANTLGDLLVADIDTANNTISGWRYPSAIPVPVSTVTLPTSSTSYKAPTDGYLSCGFLANTESANAQVTLTQTVGLSPYRTISNSSSITAYVHMPMPKGSVASIAPYNANVTSLKFSKSY